MVPIRENLVPKDKYAMKCPYTRTPTRVVIHNTANDAPAASKFIPYLIRKNCRDPLNIRKGPSTNYGILGQIKDTLRYTIVEERSGPGSHNGWGRLKAGGWIALDWVKKA